MNIQERARNELDSWQRTGKRWLFITAVIVLLCTLLSRDHYLLPYLAGAIGGLMIFIRVHFDLRGKMVLSTLSRLTLFLAMISVGTVVNKIVESGVPDAALQSTVAFGAAFATVGFVAALLFRFFSPQLK